MRFAKDYLWKLWGDKKKTLVKMYPVLYIIMIFVSVEMLVFIIGILIQNLCMVNVMRYRRG